MFRSDGMKKLAEKGRFSWQEFSEVFQSGSTPLSEVTMRKHLQEMLKRGVIVRVGSNAYCVPPHPVSLYQHDYSELAQQAAQTLQEQYPLVAFTVLELIQLNAFLNHQLAHNALFLSVEEDAMDFVFDAMKTAYPGKVLCDPTPELYHQYWYDGMIVLKRLVTEAPHDPQVPWHTRLEKLLVDLLCEKILMESISESEYPTILETAFANYVVDESSLFRYARRRGADKRLKRLIREQTNITLRTE